MSIKTFFQAHKPKFLFSAPTPDDPRKFIGESVVIDGQRHVIETIQGNVVKPNFFEINGKYLIGMLRFYKQMYHDTSITEDQLRAFEEMEHHIRKVAP